jgi:hypothetical protein
MEGESALKITELRNVQVNAERASSESNGKPIYRLTIRDPHTREVIWLAFGQEMADAIVAGLTGIEIATRLPH